MCIRDRLEEHKKENDEADEDEEEEEEVLGEKEERHDGGESSPPDYEFSLREENIRLKSRLEQVCLLFANPKMFIF